MFGASGFYAQKDANRKAPKLQVLSQIPSKFLHLLIPSPAKPHSLNHDRDAGADFLEVVPIEIVTHTAKRIRQDLIKA